MKSEVMKGGERGGVRARGEVRERRGREVGMQRESEEKKERESAHTVSLQLTVAPRGNIHVQCHGS